METQDAAEERIIGLVRGLEPSERDRVAKLVELFVKDLKEKNDRFGWTILGMTSLARVWDNEEDAIYDKL